MTSKIEKIKEDIKFAEKEIRAMKETQTDSLILKSRIIPVQIGMQNIRVISLKQKLKELE